MKRIVIIGVFFTIVAGLGTLCKVWASLPLNKVAIREGIGLVAVRRGDLDVTIKAEGRVESSQRTVVECQVENLAYLFPGRSIWAGVSTILELAEEGTQVRKGDVICRLDASYFEELVRATEIDVEEARSNYAQAQQTLQVAEIALEEYRSGLLPLETKSLESQIALTQTEVDRHGDRLAWTRRMFKKGYLSEAQVKDQTEQYERSLFRLRSLRGELGLLTRFSSQNSALRFEKSVWEARTFLAFRQLWLQYYERRLRKYRLQVERCTIRAPHDGFLIYVKEGGPKIEVGQPVWQRMKLFYLPDLTAMEVDVVLNEIVVERVRPQMPARVKIEALPGAMLEGEVTSVGMLPWHRDSLGVIGLRDERNYNGVIRLKSIPPRLLPGMTVEVDIVLERKRDRLVVPPESVVRDASGYVCFVEGATGLERRPIQLGAGGWNQIEVTEGLNEGELILGDATRLNLDNLLQ